MNWDQYRRVQANPLVIDREGRRWRLVDWDWDNHRPIDGREPLP